MKTEEYPKCKVCGAILHSRREMYYQTCIKCLKSKENIKMEEFQQKTLFKDENNISLVDERAELRKKYDEKMIKIKLTPHHRNI